MSRAKVLIILIAILVVATGILIATNISLDNPEGTYLFFEKVINEDEEYQRFVVEHEQLFNHYSIYVLTDIETGDSYIASSFRTFIPMQKVEQ